MYNMKMTTGTPNPNPNPNSKPNPNPNPIPISGETVEWESIHCWLEGIPAVPVKKTKLEIEAIKAPLDPVKKRKVEIKASEAPLDQLIEDVQHEDDDRYT
jgi:hypothetical protein